VSVVILDRKIFDGDKFAATSVSRTDYYPFGYPIASRSFSLEQYRYGFNGQEGDDEIYGDKKCSSYEFRNYDSRIGRWWSIDKKSTKYLNLSPYSFTNNNPIINKEINGKDFILTVSKVGDNNFITIKQNIYPENSIAETELNRAVVELNNLTKIITIDNIQYTVKFEITVVPPPVMYEGQTISDQGMGSFSIFNSDPYGNFYFQYRGYPKRNNEGKYVGGEAIAGKYFKMYQIPTLDPSWPIFRPGSDFPELMVHEILHLMGLTDRGGDYYDPNGRMYYNFTYQNNRMKPISTLDVINIIKYAIKYNNIEQSGKANTKIEYKDGTQTFTEESTIIEN
jgi:RHS repeat-associated protein